MPLDCPSREELSSYLLGQVSARWGEELAEHCQGCPECQAALETLDDAADSFLGQLRGVKSAADTTASGATVPPALARSLASAESLLEGDPPHEPSPTPPQRIRDYRLLEKLGEGGMGVVYKALHENLKRVVAIKLLAGRRLRDTQAAQRFRREMAAVGKLTHPNIVLAHDAGQQDGLEFIVMEYVDGADLSQIARRGGPLPIPEACEIGRQAALALAHAHEHGLVHRDVKPSNLMLARGGAVKLLDLGLARFYADADGLELTGDGQLMGTLDYMAPEQGQNSQQAGVAADIYALGATLYRLVAGRTPLAIAQRPTPVAKLQAIVHETPALLRQRRGDVPPELEGLVMRMLAKKPADRPSSSAEVAALLAPLAAGHKLPEFATRAAQRIQQPDSPENSIREAAGAPADGALHSELVREGSESRSAMAEPKFDPYYRWLGIPPQEQPADHYRLLGLRQFEPDAGVIESAADRQMTYIRTLQAGQHAELSQKLLNEISAVRVCLLDARQKAAYDAKLRAKLAAQQPPAAAPLEPQPASVIPMPATALPAQQPVQRAAQPQLVTRKAAPLPVATPLPTGPSIRTDSPALRTNTAARRKQTQRLAFVSGAAAVVVFLAAVLVIRLGNSQGELVIQSNAPGVELEVRQDGVTVNTVTVTENEHHITIRAGQYEVVIKGKDSDQLVIENDTFTLERGGQAVVKITRKPPEAAVVGKVEPGEKPKEKPQEKVTVALGPSVEKKPLPESKPKTTPKPEASSPDTSPAQSAGERKWRGKPFAKVSMPSGQPPQPLKVGNPAVDGAQWKEIPPEFGGLLFQTDSVGGKSAFEVVKPGLMLLGISGRWGGGGNASGGWQEELTTQEQFKEQGWKRAGTLTIESPHFQQVEVWGRDVKAGEKFTLRTEKYVGPVLLIPDPTAPSPDTETAAAESEGESMRVVCEALPADWGPPTNLEKSAVLFSLPQYDGRRKSRGFFLDAPAGWRQQGTAWHCQWRRSGTAYGMHFIHPVGEGHLLVAVGSGGIAIASVKQWPERGGIPEAQQTIPLKMLLTAKELEVDRDEPHELRSELSPTGSYRFYFDGKLAARGQVKRIETLEVNPEIFISDDLKNVPLAGKIGIIVGPLDGGTNRLDNVRLGAPSFSAEEEPLAAEEAPQSQLICKQLAGKRFPPEELAAGAVAFRAPNGDGRGGANGFILEAPAGWQRNGTVWSCTYRRSGSARGIHFIHPAGQGHLLVGAYDGGVAAASVGQWTGGDRAMASAEELLPLELKLDAAAMKLDNDEPHELRSELSAAGDFRFFFDGKLAATGRVRAIRALELANEDFQGDGLERRLAAGQAGVVIGPLDNGTNRADDVRLVLGTPGRETLPSTQERPAEAIAERLPVPDEAAREASRKQIEELFADELAKAKSTAQKGELAKTLLEHAAGVKENPADRYVLLEEARRLAAAAGDAPTALRALDSLAAEYEIDPWPLRLETLTAASEGGRGADFKDKAKEFAQRGLSLAEEAADADRYDIAQELTKLAAAAARKAKDVPLAKTIVERGKEFADVAAAFEAAQKSLAALEANPADPAANLAAGRFLCLTKGDWEQGLPRLAAGSDDKLKDLAAKDLDSPADAKAQVALADGWWSLAQGERGRAKEQLEVRAATWYMPAVRELAGIERTRVEGRIADLERRGLLDDAGGLRRRVVAVATGSNNHTIYLNSELLMNCRREKASSAPATLKVGDVIAVRLGDRFDIMSFWMMVLSEQGEPLLETSEKWTAYVPASKDRWWEVAKASKRAPAEFAPDTREYVDLVKRSAAEALPKQQRGQPIFSPLKADEDAYHPAYAYRVVTAGDLQPKRGSASDRPAIKLTGDSARGGKLYYKGMLGRYKQKGEPIPFVMLTVPNGKNVLSDAVQAKMREKMEIDTYNFQFAAGGYLVVPKDGTYYVEGGRAVSVFIDGKSIPLDNYGRLNGADVPLTRGVHPIGIEVINNGAQLFETSVRVHDKGAEQDLPIVVTPEEVKTLTSTPVAGGQPIEISDWKKEENVLRLRP